MPSPVIMTDYDEFLTAYNQVETEYDEIYPRVSGYLGGADISAFEYRWIVTTDVVTQIVTQNNPERLATLLQYV